MSLVYPVKIVMLGTIAMRSIIIMTIRSIIIIMTLRRGKSLRRSMCMSKGIKGLIRESLALDKIDTPSLNQSLIRKSVKQTDTRSGLAPNR